MVQPRRDLSVVARVHILAVGPCPLILWRHRLLVPTIWVPNMLCHQVTDWPDQLLLQICVYERLWIKLCDTRAQTFYDLLRCRCDCFGYFQLKVKTFCFKLLFCTMFPAATCTKHATAHATTHIESYAKAHVQSRSNLNSTRFTWRCAF